VPEGVKKAETYAEAGGYVSMCFRYLTYKDTCQHIHPALLRITSDPMRQSM
jgi:hypothetical protein